MKLEDLRAKIGKKKVPYVTELIEPGGLLSEMLEGYRPRPGQVALAEAVEGAIRDGRHLLSEAPTGTGKSHAYGLPAALYAVVEEETVVVATANITLQEQLIDKDLPVIAKVVELATGEDLEYRLVKGMSNYLCLDSLEECLRVGADDWIDELVEWANKTKTGDKSELEKEYPARIWGRVSSTSEDCLRDKCKFRAECFVFKSKESDWAPHIVVTNYHMLFTDLVVREATAGKASVLPDYDVLVMDEAHEAKDIAMSFQGYEWHIARVRWLVNRLRSTKIDGASKRADRLLAIAGHFFGRLAEYEDPRERDTIIRGPLGWDEGIVSNLQNTSSFLRNYALSQKPRSDDEKAVVARIQKLGEVFLKRSAEVDSVCTGIGDGDLPYGMVYYTEKKPGGDIALCCKGVEVQEFLREQLFDQKTVICTSATLTTNNNFQFVADELGLKDGEFSAIISPEVFDPRQMLVVIPEDMPSPKDRDLHMNATAQVVDYLKEELGGRILALFTSYKAMGHTAKFLSKYHDTSKIFLQGDMPKSRIISMFKKDPEAIILATASFWQGVDIPGQALSCLIIDKFPFLPPTDPVLKYMGGKPGSDGMSAFFEYSIPKAVIAMKQGVGRLIRSETDYGVVVLCDNRLITKGYGSQFEKALPFGHYRSNRLSDAKDFLKEMANA